MAQHDGPLPSGLPQGQGREVNTISITPVEPVKALPVVQVESAPLPDVGPDRMTEAFLDGLFAGQVAAGRIPGAAVVIIRNGEVVLKKGYGFADLAQKTSVDPDRTRFRVASISKLFTALAVMQEAESGRLDLDEDVNTYLKDFKVASMGPGRVSVRTLLDHTSGFDDKYLNLATPRHAKRVALADYLAGNVPRAVFEPGKVLNYSNYGYALAGHLAAQSAGADFDRLMAERFFGPLQMNASQFGIDREAAKAMATPYARSPSGLTPARFDQVTPAPAGDLTTTADDLSRFMMALADQGGGLVRPETFSRMLDAQITPGATGDGWGLGFALGETNGVKWFGHGGAWSGYAAELRIDGKTKSGFLILLNTDNAFDVVQPLVNAVSDRIWPAPPPRPRADQAKAALAAGDLEGTFIPVRRARDDFTKVGLSFTSMKLVRAAGGSLTGTFGGLAQRLTFVPDGPGVWVESTFRWRLSAYRGQGGARDGVLLGPFAFERAGFSEDLTAQGPLIAGAAAVFTLTLAMWGAGVLNRKLFGEPMAAIPFWPRAAGMYSAATGLSFLLGFAVAMGAMSQQDILQGQTSAAIPALLMPVLAVLAAPVAVYFAIRGFGPGLRARLAQAWFVLLTLSLMFVLWFAWTWNLHIFAR